MAAETHVAENNTVKKDGKRRNKFKKERIQRWKGKLKPKISESKIIENLQNSYNTIDTSKVQNFSDLPLSEKTLKGLKEHEFVQPTEIQRESLRYSLQGHDILGAAKTGSGKTLAFLIPVLEQLYCKQWTNLDGLGALIITPTRELAFQIFEMLKKVGKYHDFSAGLIIGGKDLKFESKRMDRCNIVIGTPGRILQHMDENPLFECLTMKVLVLDEADRCLDLGFEKTMNSIIENLPAERQTLLFSATQTKSVRDLARLSLHDPMYVSVHENAAHATPEGLRQSYMVCELHDKLPMLWSFLRNHTRKKVLVFFSSCKQVKYMYEIFCRLRPGVCLLALYGTLHQMRRMAVYDEFCRKKHAVLFATDVAARGLDFPAVDWVLQLDCPEDAATYVHRAGRTARYNRGGESLLVLIHSEEEAMLANLHQQKVPVEKIQVNPRKLQNPQRKIEALLARDPELKASAQRAFLSYVKAVFLMKDKKVFDVNALDLDTFATSLGLAMAPRVRFLQRRQKKQALQAASSSVKIAKESSEEEKSEEEEQTSQTSAKDVKKESYNFSTGLSDEEEDEEEDDVLTMKRKDHDLETEDTNDLVVEEGHEDMLTKSVVTKAAVAKRILKKKIKPNKKTIFDEEGEAVRDAAREKVSEVARQYEAGVSEEGGINLNEAKQALKEEDKFDKQRFKERLKIKKREAKLKLKQKRRKEKGLQEEDVEDEFQSEESDGPDLSWLPDPDKIYGKEGDKSSEEEKPAATSEEESEPEEPKRKKKKFMLIEKEVKPKQKRQKDLVSKGSGLSLQEDEELALQFLRGGH